MQPDVLADSDARRAAPIDFVDAVVTHHLNTFRSGVARFNEVLASEMGVPLVGTGDVRLAEFRRALLSFKVSEMEEHERLVLKQFLEADGREFDFYFHAWDGLPLEIRLAQSARQVFCGNADVEERIQALGVQTRPAWTPGLLLDQRTLVTGEVSVFSFGMAHKIQTDMFDRLRRLLDAVNRSYALYVSTANHETSSIRDAQLVYAEMHDIFPTSLFFMGNLSDVAVLHYLRTTTFFAAFFPGGVRANNTSVAAAMEHGALVITNLDRHSPAEFRHLENVIDITRCEELPTDPLVMKRISVAAMETARERSWDALVQHMQPGAS